MVICIKNGIEYWRENIKRIKKKKKKEAWWSLLQQFYWVKISISDSTSIKFDLRYSMLAYLCGTLMFNEVNIYIGLVFYFFLSSKDHRPSDLQVELQKVSCTNLAIWLMGTVQSQVCFSEDKLSMLIQRHRWLCTKEQDNEYSLLFCLWHSLFKSLGNRVPLAATAFN